MAERRKTVTDQHGNPVEGTVVEVAESTERFSEISLTDGTVLRIKTVVTEAVRLDGKWDQDGHPMYIVRSSNIVSVVDSPAELGRVQH